MIIKCSKCGKERKYRLSIVRRLKSDLCRKCYYKIMVAWNRGTKGICKPNKTSFKKGNIPWIKGKKQTEKIKRKLSKTHKKSFANGRIIWNKGKPWSKGMKERFSNSHKGQRAWNRGIPATLKEREQLKKLGIMGCLKQQTMKGPTSIEKKVYDELKRRGILFETQKLIKGKFVVDAYIPSLNLIIEADGDYWHSLDRVKKRDKAKNAYLKACGFNLLRFTETEINNGEFRKELP